MAAVEMSLNAPPVETDRSSSHCSPCKTIVGIVPWVGVAADVVTVASAATTVGTGNLNAMYVTICGGATSAVAHVIEWIATRVLWPKKTFEQNAGRVQDAASGITTNVIALQKTIQSLQDSDAASKRELELARAEIEQARTGNLKEIQEVQKARDAFQAELVAERAGKGQLEATTKELFQTRAALEKELKDIKIEDAQLQERSQKELMEKTQRIDELTHRLEAVERALKEAEELTKRWENAVGQISKALSSGDTSKLTQLVEGLRGSEGTFKSEADQLEDSAAATGRMLNTVSGVATQLQDTLSKLMGDNVQERELLAKAESEKKDLAESYEKIRTERKKLERERKKFEETKADVQQMSEKLQRLAEALKDGSAQKNLEAILAQTPTEKKS